MPPKRAVSFYTNEDYVRPISVSEERSNTWRSPFRRDYARLLHSPVFRRLHGKTQLFSGLESDFFRNRLTHSLEVAQIAKSIATRLNSTAKRNGLGSIDLDLVEFAGLAHDLGHPPFGHTGEQVLNELMSEHGGFEGNAQTLHILTRLEKKLDDPTVQMHESGDPVWFGDDGYRSFGLNLCYRTISSILKYDRKIPERITDGKIKKGYYASEEIVVTNCRSHVAPNFQGQLKTIECQIMDLADDIAYSTYDLEDALKAGLLDPLDLLFPRMHILEAVATRARVGLGENEFTAKEAEDALHECLSRFKETAGISKGASTLGSALALAKTYSSDGFYRNSLTSELVNRFTGGVRISPNPRFPSMSEITLDKSIHKQVESLKHFTFVTMIESSRLKTVAMRARFIVKEIMKTLMSDHGYELLPPDFAQMHAQAKQIPSPENASRACMRVICDFVAGMTDRYAVEFFCRLRSENYQTIFRHIGDG